MIKKNKHTEIDCIIFKEESKDSIYIFLISKGISILLLNIIKLYSFLKHALKYT